MASISTTQLAKRHDRSGKEVFAIFSKEGFIERQNDEWVLTEKGKSAGGDYKESKQYGKYIIWPEDMAFPGESEQVKHEGDYINATKLGEHFNLPARRMNTILSELGWIEKHLKGWKVTGQGLRIGGKQRESAKTGIPYVTWPDILADNKNLKKSIDEVTGEGIKTIPDEAPTTNKFSEFRSSVPKQRTADGHYVRSRAEMLIDNWLYMAEIVHAYERRLPIEEEVYCDFYLPVGKVYIEFWGMESNEKYAERKKEKKGIYEKYGLNLVELNDEDIINLDDVLPRLLLKHGITTY